MVAINFQARFADLVASGRKTQTIRGKNRFKTGDKLQLYTGQRTKDCRKLADVDPICLGVWEIKISDDSIMIVDDDANSMMRDDLDKFAQKDGFKNFTEMSDWFQVNHGLPFYGYLVKWGKE